MFSDLYGCDWYYLCEMIYLGGDVRVSFLDLVVSCVLCWGLMVLR